MSRLNTRRWLLLLVTALLAAAGLGGASQSGAADTAQAALLWLNPASSSIAVGNSNTLTLQLDDITEVYGMEVALTFDPAFLEVIGDSVTPGDCPEPDFVVVNTVDNSAGTIAYAVTQLGSVPPCDGGTVASIEFQCKAQTSPSTTVSIDSSTISDSDGSPIAHTTQNAEVTCTGGFAVVGTVSLQAWPNGPEGAAVTLADSSGSTVDQQIVGPDGAFSLTAADVSETYHVEASHPRYLTAQATGITAGVGDTINLGVTTLPAGDLNGDGAINILDITVV
ncbi:MAG: cohesin domain-containing protein, partial [Anaerolineae bacterium]